MGTSFSLHPDPQHAGSDAVPSSPADAASRDGACPHPASVPQRFSPTADHEAIDHAINVLAEELGAEAVAELLESFLDDAPDQLRQIFSLAESSDQATLRRAAHSLKGTAALFGVFSLEAASLRMEKLASASQTAEQMSQAVAVAQRFADALPALNSALKRLLAASRSAHCASG